jgi:hypothetical protein
MIIYTFYVSDFSDSTVLFSTTVMYFIPLKKGWEQHNGGYVILKIVST